MKKLRGKRRYFRRMWAQIKETGIDTSVESWYAFSHTHLDFWDTAFLVGNYVESI